MGSCTRIRTYAVAAGLLFAFTPTGVRAAGAFVRGLVTEGARHTSVSDAVNILRHLFAEPAVELECQDAADVNDDGQVSVQDAIHVLRFLFELGAPPADPFPACGFDATKDELGCERFPGCSYAVFYVVDRSGGFGSSGGLSIAKREVSRSIAEFSLGVEFGIVFFDAGVRVFPAERQPVLATEEAKTAAIDFVASVAAGGGSCPQLGFFAALDFVDLSDAERIYIVYIGDGGGTCQGLSEADYLQQTIEVVTERNQGRARINVIAIGWPGHIQEDFMRRLAAANGGSYTVRIR